MRVSVLGLGIMGAGMAHNLVAKGFEVAVYNRSPDKAAPFAAKARIAVTPAEAARDADIIIAMLSDDDASRGVWLSDGGALGAARPGAIIIECGTLSPSWVRELAAAAGKVGVGFIDAPVTGSKLQAQEGTLRFLAGGSPSDLLKAGPVLGAMGSETIHMGGVGSGVLMKLVNNFLCGVQVAALAEGLAMAEKSGLDGEKTRAVLLGGAPGSPLVKAVAGRIAAGDYTANFFPGLMAKDLDYAGREAAKLGLTLETAAAARKRFLEAVKAGYADKDIAAIIEPLRHPAGD